MTSSVVNKLLQLMPSPQHPCNAHGDWTSIEEKLDLVFPDDYKAFIATYGSGSIDSDLAILNYIDIIDQEAAMQILSMFRELREGLQANDELAAKAYKQRLEDSVPSFPWPIHPEPCGILPWGHAPDGWDFFWLTKADPREWSVLVSYHGFGQTHDFSGISFLQFILQLLQAPFSDRFLLRHVFTPALPED